MQTIIRDTQALVGMLESGDLNSEMTETVETVLKKLQELSNDQPKNTFKGEVTLKLKFAVKNGMVDIDAEIPPPKLPKLPRKTSVYFLTDEGRLSTEHPQQRDMFGGPREIDHRRQQ
ncbi:hypothetical protein HW571_25125 [Agrobacterium genomosp. 3]|uniref:hypothetical protein n=1 Tax=Agrobacterium tomkonis TaxID=1183410 RepID=UPI001CD8F365|nr:hypothetical protein [Agrobacterium tomkonis]MCA1879340.1 hypothetical protein [Agrobacterium tumefaciens]MCA1894503.1 hypothetical protein [Agrobacterium tomkonis]